MPVSLRIVSRPMTLWFFLLVACLTVFPGGGVLKPIAAQEPLRLPPARHAERVEETEGERGKPVRSIEIELRWNRKTDSTTFFLNRRSCAPGELAIRLRRFGPRRLSFKDPARPSLSSVEALVRCDTRVRSDDLLLVLRALASPGTAIWKVALENKPSGKRRRQTPIPIPRDLPLGPGDSVTPKLVRCEITLKAGLRRGTHFYFGNVELKGAHRRAIMGKLRKRLQSPPEDGVELAARLTIEPEVPLGDLAMVLDTLRGCGIRTSWRTDPSILVGRTLVLRRSVGQGLPAQAWTRIDSAALSASSSGAVGGKRGNRNALPRPKDVRRSQGAVDRGLDWLAKHQSPDGMWDCRAFMKNGNKDLGPPADGAGEARWNVGATGLALLSFLGAGETHTRGPHSETVARGLKWLMKQQGPEGCFGPTRTSASAWNHALASQAIIEACAMTGSSLFKRSAEKALRFISACQNDDGVWSSRAIGGSSDSAVTGWMLLALHSAEVAGFSLEKDSMARVLAWTESMTDQRTGRFGEEKGARPPVPSRSSDEFPDMGSDALTAAAICVRIFSGQNPQRNRMVRLGVENVLLARLPRRDTGPGSVDMFFWYFGTIAMFQVGGEPWKKWDRAIRDAIISHQRKDANFSGSWDPVGVWGPHGDRVCSTALMTLCLEVYYRYRRVSGKRK